MIGHLLSDLGFTESLGCMFLIILLFDVYYLILLFLLRILITLSSLDIRISYVMFLYWWNL